MSSPALPEVDRSPSAAEQARIESLSAAELAAIDDCLLEHCQRYWRRMSMVVGIAVETLEQRHPLLPEVYYAQRLRALVNAGELDGRGDLDCMGAAEVRLAR